MTQLSLPVGDLGELDWAAIVSLMAFPDCQEKRKEAFTALFVRHNADNKEPSSSFDIIVQSEFGGMPAFRQAQERSQKHGTLAGALLICHLTLGLHDPSNASINKARAMVERFGITNVEDVDKRNHSGRTVKKAWSRFGPVAHLYASAYIGATPSGEYTWRDAPDFLARAEAMRLGALKLGLSGAERMIAISNIPKLPKTFVRFDALTPAAIQILKNYKPED